VQVAVQDVHGVEDQVDQEVAAARVLLGQQTQGLGVEVLVILRLAPVVLVQAV
jgi:hypothetical protein